jgi:putative ABC transport system permease protein
MEQKSALPKYIRTLCEVLLPQEVKSGGIQDFEHAFEQISDNKGRFAADIWFWFQILLVILPIIIERVLRTLSMFKTYFKIALANIKRQKVSSVINITGLAAGLAFSIMLSLWIRDELTYDAHHEYADNIYRVVSYYGDKATVFTPVPMAQTLIDAYPVVLEAVRISGRNRILVVKDEKRFIESMMLFADPSIFDVFSIPLIKGDTESVLSEPYSVIITERIAGKYFGDMDPIDKFIQIENRDRLYKVTGIVEEAPSNSHFHYDFIASFSSLKESQRTDWGNDLNTYILCNQDADYKSLESKFNVLIQEKFIPDPENRIEYRLQPLKDIHLHSHVLYEFEPSGNIQSVYIFSAITALVFFMACCNYLNLSTASSIRRTKEVGIRKVLGSTKVKIIEQFLCESILSSAIAFTVALLLVEFCLPFFNDFTGKNLAVNYIENHETIPLIICLVFIIGIASGWYPAFFVSSFQPANVFRGRFISGKDKGFFKNTLVLFQFVITFFVIISTLVVHEQLEFIQKRDLGFNKENVLIINRIFWEFPQKDSYTSELLQNPNIKNVSFANHLPGDDLHAEMYNVEGGHADDGKIINIIYTDNTFSQTMGLKIKYGRTFSKDIASDSMAVIINEKAAKILGLKNPIGKRLVRNDAVPGDPIKPKTVIGVFENFHFKSLHSEIEPFMIEKLFKNWGGTNIVRISPDNVAETIGYIKQVSEKYAPDELLGYHFLDDNIDSLYYSEKRTGRILIIFTLLTVFVACIGLFGLVYYTCQQRKKEISIRKVLGASEIKIAILSCWN